MARLQQRKQAAVTTGPAETSGIPCAIVLTLIRGLPGDRLDCPRRLRARRYPQTWHQHRDARTTRFHVRVSLRSSCAADPSTAPRTPRIVTTRTSLFDEAGCGRQP